MFEYILVYRPSYRHNRKIFIVSWITYIYVWQRFERYLSHHRAKWIDLFPLYIVDHFMIIFPTMVRNFIQLRIKITLTVYLRIFSNSITKRISFFIELREAIYESFFRKFDGDFEFIRIEKRFDLRRFELERVNCTCF